jgi:thioredoxin 1
VSTYYKLGIVIALLTAVLVVVYVKTQQEVGDLQGPGGSASHLPRLVDLGADSCIPCKLMAPILVELRQEFAGRLQVDFIDVWKKPAAGRAYGVEVIPTQIFFDASGKELARHVGFISKEDILARWQELGVPLAAPAPTLVREVALQPSTRPADQACFMCDGDIAPTTLVEVKTTAATRRFCSPHCFFIYLSSLPKPEGIEDATTITLAATGQPVAAKAASYRLQYDPKGRPVIEAVAGTGVAGTLSWDALKDKEFAVRCAFCDRITYPEDSARLKVDGTNLYACCPVCGLGVAARLHKDIELDVKDALTGEALHIVTFDGSVAALTPASLAAWHGQKKTADGAMTSAGCFKQFFFANPDNLKRWLDGHPESTGKMATIGELLADKMKLNPQQIKNACKIGDCIN